MHRREIKTWTASTSEHPTWRNGLDESDRTYLIVAVPKISRKGYAAIVFGRYSGSSGKLKFYPNPEAMGIDRRGLLNAGMHSMIDRADYTSLCCTLEQAKDLLKTLSPEDWVVCPLGELESALKEQRGRADSRSRAPLDGEFVPVEVKVEDPGGITVVATEEKGEPEDPGLKFVIDLLKEQSGAEDIGPDQQLYGADGSPMDSLDTVEAVITLEDRLGVEIPDGTIDGLKTAKELLGKLRENPGWSAALDAHLAKTA